MKKQKLQKNRVFYVLKITWRHCCIGNKIVQEWLFFYYKSMVSQAAISSSSSKTSKRVTEKRYPSKIPANKLSNGACFNSSRSRILLGRSARWKRGVLHSKTAKSNEFSFRLTVRVIGVYCICRNRQLGETLPLLINTPLCSRPILFPRWQSYHSTIVYHIAFRLFAPAPMIIKC